MADEWKGLWVWQVGGRKATVQKVRGSNASLLSQRTYVVSLINECIACIELSPHYRIDTTLKFGVRHYLFVCKKWVFHKENLRPESNILGDSHSIIPYASLYLSLFLPFYVVSFLLLSLKNLSPPPGGFIPPAREDVSV